MEQNAAVYRQPTIPMRCHMTRTISQKKSCFFRRPNRKQFDPKTLAKYPRFPIGNNNDNNTRIPMTIHRSESREDRNLPVKISTEGRFLTVNGHLRNQNFPRLVAAKIPLRCLSATRRTLLHTSKYYRKANDVGRNVKLYSRLPCFDLFIFIKCTKYGLNDYNVQYSLEEEETKDDYEYEPILATESRGLCLWSPKLIIHKNMAKMTQCWT